MITTTATKNGPRPTVRCIYSPITQPQLYNDYYPECQNTPTGLISIAFSRSTIRSIYTDNDPIRGVVHLKSNIKAKSVSIQFIGRITCTSEGTVQHVSSTDLFRYAKSLQQIAMPSENCPPRRIEYPFEFRFPDAVELAPRVPHPTHPAFESEPGHPLPPSLWWNNDTVRIEYVLEATFASASPHATVPPKVIQQLRFSPCAPDYVPQAHTTLPIPISYPTQRSLAPSPLRRLRTHFSSTPAPLLAAPASPVLTLTVPERFRVGAPASILVTLHPQSLAATHCATPSPVYLLGIRALATCRITHLPPSSSLAISETQTSPSTSTSPSTFTLLARRHALPGLPLAPGVATPLDPFTISTTVPPGFRTYGVALEYEVLWEVVVGCGGLEGSGEGVVRGVGVVGRGARECGGMWVGGEGRGEELPGYEA
ncbi:hypothetical protein C7974DRAFT_439634 [Boeremia exigua]|uniref:uncharacterized protein n=1 Tax=Boeremia exigua TaxID=749465 RepID=UPI001E8EC8F6|nr:uncharacterized protein C7974DRAFT_439634 [Boeremia exigua]KAH6644325.1 hypothetical protein C7974DRAFT_439634 [Boeremia exigua]